VHCNLYGKERGRVARADGGKGLTTWGGGSCGGGIREDRGGKARDPSLQRVRSRLNGATIEAFSQSVSRRMRREKHHRTSLNACKNRKLTHPKVMAGEICNQAGVG
jgi:hypothetical protein